MKQKTATFYGSKLDQNGMPDPFYRYLVIADTTPNSGKGSVATTFPFTGGPTPNRNFFTAANDDAALDDAIAALRALPQIKGKNLTEHIS